MTSVDIKRTIADIGYAKVIAVLKPSAIGADFLAAGQLSEPVELARNFMRPDARQFADLALTARTFSSRPTRRMPQPAAPKVKVYPRLGLALGYVDKEGAAALSADSRISSLVQAPELSLIRPVSTTLATETVDVSWGIKRLKVDQLWTKGYTGKGIVVGHIDTGVDGNHPDLAGAIKSFAEFDFAGEMVKGAKPNDSGTHGTHTAGTIAGRPGARGAFGVAPGAKLASAMVIEGGSVIDRILAGLEWLAGENCRVISMSLGLRGYTPAFEVVISAIRDLNILPVIAIGNEYANTSRSPGNYVNVLSVGASTDTDEVAAFSSSQRFQRELEPLVPRVVAPGVDTFSCLPNGDYGLSSGTSMATPHIAGLAAVLWEAKPSATASEIERVIVDSCIRPKSMGADRANHGVPDAVIALGALLEPATTAAIAASAGGKRASPTKRKASLPKAANARRRSTS